MTSVLNGNGSFQNSMGAIRNQFYNIGTQLNKLNETVDKLIDVVREIAIKTDVSMESLDNTVVAQNVATPVSTQSAPVLSGNVRRR
jgi:hypothetical protein